MKVNFFFSALDWSIDLYSVISFEKNKNKSYLVVRNASSHVLDFLLFAFQKMDGHAHKQV